MQKPFHQAGKLFSAEIWKMAECHFWADVMLRQSHVRASRASPAQKSQGLRVVCCKNFSRSTFFVFWVTWLVDSFLSYLPVKRIWRKRAVWCLVTYKVFFVVCHISEIGQNKSQKSVWCPSNRTFLQHLTIFFLNNFVIGGLEGILKNRIFINRYLFHICQNCNFIATYV